MPLARALYLLWALALSAVLIVLSENLLFRDFGDYVRAIGFMLQMTPDATGQLWPFRIDGQDWGQRFDLANFVFGSMGWVQSWYADHFDLRFSAIAAKLLLLFYADLLARTLARQFRNPWRARVIAFTALALTMFYAHNAGMLKSFYGEYIFFLVLPLLLYGLLCWEQRAGQWAIVLAALIGGLSKVQYFCMPLTLLAVLLLLRAMGRMTVPRWVLWSLAASQLITAAPAVHNPYAQLNRHQATYWGSYLVLNPDQLHALGLSQRQQACVGIDGWGHQAQGPGGSEPVNVGREKTCYGSQQLGLWDVLRPYVLFPTTLPKLLAYALPAHMHVRYFHVFKVLPYLTPANGASFRSGRWLVKWSELRDRTVTPLWPVLWGLGLAQVAWRGARRHAGLSAASLFLALFVASQIAVSLLGEGVRDLGKHLWAAQLALDFLLLTLLAQCAVYWGRQPSSAMGQPEPTSR